MYLSSATAKSRGAASSGEKTGSEVEEEEEDEEPTEAAFAGATPAVRGRLDVEPAPAAGGGRKGARAAFILLETLHKTRVTVACVITGEKNTASKHKMQRAPQPNLAIRG